VRRSAPSGELGDDVEVVDATDRNGDTYPLALAVGDRVRLFDRVHDARIPGRKTVLANNNGEVVELRELSDEGIIVRNDAGVEGLVAWRKIRTRRDGPVRLAYGYAMTVDTAARQHRDRAHPRAAGWVARDAPLQSLYRRQPPGTDDLDRRRRSRRAPPARRPVDDRAETGHP
jgi:hypothetical protein